MAHARAAGLVAAKLYPAGATTHSDAGVRDVARLDAVFRAMAEHELVLQLHGEVVDPECDVFEREARFVTRVLAPLCQRHPDLRIVLEHVTSAAAVAFVRGAGANVAATVTAHHLEVERGDLFRGGLRTHLYCLPLPKTSADRAAVLEAALSGHPRFFLGSDSAPHPRTAKESACCPAGVYSGQHALLHYAETFDRHGALDRLEAFASHFGADFYRLPRNADSVALVRAPLPVPSALPFGAGEVVPYRAGETLAWRVVRA
jgi:dihydroorotase